ncbi:MAG: CBS domain-containing protein [Lautropia sp.]|nr:CBS domain-containing protein [Lautropia sp.]
MSEALRLMHQQRVGSIPVVDAGGHIVGILTRYDVLGRITLPQLPLDTPIDQVMSSPVRSLGTEDSALEAALLMSQHGIRHVPVTRGGRLVGIVSERDLFAIQRLSIKQIGTAIRSARALDTLEQAGADIRRFAGILLGQGVQARQLTRLISRLNDALTVRIVESIAADRGMNLHRAPAGWLPGRKGGKSRRSRPTRTTGCSSRVMSRRRTGRCGSRSPRTSTRRSMPAAFPCAAAM